MVVCAEWQRAALEQKSGGCWPMSGDHSGLGASVPPLAGYLGKVQERASSLEFCPWCSSKGLTSALRTYPVNLHESITLCTDPQCLFPLVSRPLEDVLASLVPVAPSPAVKRKSSVPQEIEEPAEPATKHFKTNSGERDVAQCGQTGENGFHQAVGGSTDADEAFGETAREARLQDVCVALEKELEMFVSSEAVASPVGAEEVKSPSEVCASSRQQASDVPPSESRPPSSNGAHTEHGVGNLPESKAEALAQRSVVELEQLLPAPERLFWRNSDRLCWLDSLLVVLVNCARLRRSTPEAPPEQADTPVRQLIATYDSICADVRAHYHADTDGVVRVPCHVLHKANADLQRLRMSVFTLLQPKLHCKLGGEETPVFALPLLLAADQWAEPLFQLSFHWAFECSSCLSTTRQSVTKTLPTFTNIVHDWRPLHAVHLGPCNACQKEMGRRAMVLESVPGVMALHFVDGLHDSNMDVYAFSHGGKRYSVTAVIQYDRSQQHFVTWIRHEDGSWLQFDDLKHPACPSHPELPVPAKDIHVVFWEEAEPDDRPHPCSPHSSPAAPPPPQTQPDVGVSEGECVTGEPPTGDSDCGSESLLAAHNDTDLVAALTPSDVTETSVLAGADVSIGSTTMLYAFEGLSHDDIITLTFVEMKDDNTAPLPQPPSPPPPSPPPPPPSDEGHNAEGPQDKARDMDVQDSSSMVESDTSHQSPSQAANHSESETADDLSDDPPYVPPRGRGKGRGRGRGRGRPRAGRQKAKKEEVVKTASIISAEAKAAKAAKEKPGKVAQEKPDKAAEEKLGKVAKDKRAKAATPPRPAETQTQTPQTRRKTAMSSTHSSPPPPPPSSPPPPPLPTTSEQQARWSYMLSRHPLSQVNKSLGTRSALQPPVSARAAKPAAAITHSTPIPTRRIPSVLPKTPILRQGGMDGFPVKAAEMYSGFGAHPHTPPPPAAPPPLGVGAKQTEATAPVCQNSPAFRQPFPAPDVFSRKHSADSQLPAGLGYTEALRYKLLKKLKAKKKKLAKLNQLLSQGGGAELCLTPDSTALSSPATVSSSTYDGSTVDDFLSDLLSPATTASNLSPDSTDDFLEMLTRRQDAGAGKGGEVANGAADSGDFLELLVSQAATQQQTQMEAESLSELDLFF